MDRNLADFLAVGGGAARGSELTKEFGRRQVDWARHSGALIAASSNTWLAETLTTDLEARWRRATVEIGRPLILCGASAAQLHGFGVVDDGRLHVTTRTGWSKPGPPGIVVHQAPPRTPEILVDGVPATAAADSAVDLATTVAELDVLVVLDAALRAGVDPEALSAAIDLAKGRRGLRQVRCWAPYADWRSESPMESRARFRLLDEGLPPADLQVGVTSGGRPSRFLDLGWRGFKVGCEYDGEEFHGLDRLSGDRQRHNDLADAGWTMFYLTSRDVFRDHHALIRKVGRALRSAGWTGFVRRPPDIADVPRPAGPAAELLDRPRSTWSDPR